MQAHIGEQARLEDRALIYQTLVSMAAGLDRPDWELYSGSMTPDVVTILAGDSSHPGFPERSVIGPKAAWDGAMAVISELAEVTHYVMNVAYKFDGPDSASTAAEALITMLRPPKDDSQVLLTRGFRYRDNFVRSNNQWLISKRVMVPLWMTRSETVPVDYSQEHKN
jgi:hypothetical protein